MRFGQKRIANFSCPFIFRLIPINKFTIGFELQTRMALPFAKPRSLYAKLVNFSRFCLADERAHLGQRIPWTEAERQGN